MLASYLRETSGRSRFIHPSRPQSLLKVEQLVALGFGDTKAHIALERCSGNVEAAAEWLFSNAALISDDTLLESSPSAQRHPQARQTSEQEKSLGAFFGGGGDGGDGKAAMSGGEGGGGGGGGCGGDPTDAPLPRLNPRPEYDRDMVSDMV